MTTLTNMSKAGVVLPTGQYIAPKASVNDVSSEVLSHVVVKAWIDTGKLAKGESAARDAAEDDGKALDDMNDEELRGFLAGHGVTADGRWGRDKLVTEAKKVSA
jgi:hypothetical protein